MSNREIDNDLEVEIESENEEKKSSKKNSLSKGTIRRRGGGGFLGKFIALLLGLILGIVCGIGGLGFIGYQVILKKTVKQTADTVTSLTGIQIPLDEYLNAEYADKTVLALAQDLMTVGGKLADGTGTLNDMKAITPKIEKLVTGETGIISIFEDFGITLDPEEVMNKKLVKPSSVTGENTDYFMDYLMAEIKEEPAGDFLRKQGLESNELIDDLIYGHEGEDYDIVDGVPQMRPGKHQLTVGDFFGNALSDRFNNISMKRFLDEQPDNALIMYVLYGKKGVHYDVVDGVVTPLQQRVAVFGHKVFNAYGELMEGAVASGDAYTLNDVTYTLKTPSFKTSTIEWKETIEGVEVSFEEEVQWYYVQLDGEDLMYKAATIGSLKDGSIIANITTRLTLGDVYEDADKNNILKHLSDTTISNLSKAINDLTFSQVFSEDFYYRGKDSSGVIKTDYHVKEIDGVETIVNKDGTIATGVTLCTPDGTEVSFENKDDALSGAWKYILRKDGEIDHSLKLMEMTGIMDNMMNNVHTATVRELQQDGMISGLTDEMLNQTLKNEIPTVEEVGGIPTLVNKPITIQGTPASEHGTTVGDLSVDELLEYTSNLLVAFNG